MYMKDKLEFCKPRKRINWYLVLCCFTSSDIHSKFLLYDLQHPQVKSRSRQAHNFLLHWFGKEWCDRWLNKGFYDESKILSQLSRKGSIGNIYEL